MTLESDRKLLDAFRKGERWALERVYILYANQIARFLGTGFSFQSGGESLRYVGTASQFQLEDWTHDVFIRAFSESARLQYDGLRPYGPYLERIARNLVLDELRRKEHKIRQHVDALPEPAEVSDFAASPAVDLERQLEDKELRRSVADFLATLPARERRVYELRFIEELDQKEVAEKAGLSTSKVKTSERRIREGFLDYLTHKGWFEQGISKNEHANTAIAVPES